MLIDILIYLSLFLIKFCLGACAYMCYIEDEHSSWSGTFVGLAIGITICQYILS